MTLEVFVSVPNSNLYLYFRCCKLTGETKSEAILTTCLLLPPLHAASLTVLMRFLAQVAQNSIHNKMDSKSLAIVFTPCLFPVSESATNLKKVESTNADLATKLDIVETLIKNATKVRNWIFFKNLEQCLVIIFKAVKIILIDKLDS